ncbi:hypothetical protein YIM1627_06580 [Thermus oshimai]
MEGQEGVGLPSKAMEELLELGPVLQPFLFRFRLPGPHGFGSATNAPIPRVARLGQKKVRAGQNPLAAVRWRREREPEGPD